MHLLNKIGAFHNYKMEVNIILLYKCIYVLKKKFKLVVREFLDYEFSGP